VSKLSLIFFDLTPRYSTPKAWRKALWSAAEWRKVRRTNFLGVWRYSMPHLFRTSIRASAP